MKPPDVAVVGLSCVDCVASAPVGRWSMMNPVGDVRMAGGGLGNALLALSGLGLRVAVATRVGADAFGDFLLRLWTGLGIDCTAVTRDPALPAGLAFVVDHGTDRTPFFSPGATRAFSRADIPASLYEGAGCVLVFFAGALPSFDGEGLRGFAAACRAAGTPVLLDASDGTGADYGALRSYLPYVDLVVNAEEARRITGHADSRAAARALSDMHGGARRPGSFVGVTRPDGVSIAAFTSEGTAEVDVASPFHGRPVRMAVGAGDAFRAGLAAYLVGHAAERAAGQLDWREAGLFACAAAYLSLCRTSDTRPPFDRAELDGLLGRG